MNGSPIQPTRRPTDRTKWQLDCAAPQEGGETGGRAFNPSRLRTRDSWAARRPLSTGSSSGTRQQQPGCSFHGQNKQQIQTGSFKHNHSLIEKKPHPHRQQPPPPTHTTNNTTNIDDHAASRTSACTNPCLPAPPAPPSRSLVSVKHDLTPAYKLTPCAPAPPAAPPPGISVLPRGALAMSLLEPSIPASRSLIE